MMSDVCSRRRFFGTVSAACGAAAFLDSPLSARAAEETDSTRHAGTTPASVVSPSFPSQDAESIRAVVGAAHTQYDSVKEMVSARPALAKASWDWGYGDWESALGAASHMGRRDIAELLIEFGARPNIFTFAMLGHLDAVKAAIEAMPGIERVHGPHGITLLQHARNRLRWDNLTADEKTRGKQMVEYLESLPGADVTATSLPITEEQKQIYIGKYAIGPGTDDVLTVDINSRGMLAIRRAEQFSRVLNRVEPHTFAPGGAADVRIRFEVSDNRTVSLTVHDPVPVVRALRITDQAR